MVACRSYILRALSLINMIIAKVVGSSPTWSISYFAGFFLKILKGKVFFYGINKGEGEKPGV
jgi:hypothetical protein